MISQQAGAAVKKTAPGPATAGLRTAGFAGLVLLTAALFGHGLVLTLAAGRPGWPLAALNLLIITGLARALARETAAWINTADRGAPFAAGDALDFLAVLAGTLVTFTLSGRLGLGAVSAAGLTGLLAALLLPAPRAAAAYCGAFAGMACPQLFCADAAILLAGTVSGLFYVMAGPALAGYGGKLGTIAFGGTLAAAALTGRRVYGAPIPEWPLGLAVTVVSLLAALLTYRLNTRSGHGPVLASAAVGLAGGLLLPALDPVRGPLLAVAAICASFAGMSSPRRIGHPANMIAAGLFCGFAFQATSSCFGGAGGKLGTIAFGAVIAAGGLAAPGRRRPGPGGH